jgi:hypothetical protein
MKFLKRSVQVPAPEYIKKATNGELKTLPWRVTYQLRDPIIFQDQPSQLAETPSSNASSVQPAAAPYASLSSYGCATRL